jgi:hypothetical protein
MPAATMGASSPHRSDGVIACSTTAQGPRSGHLRVRTGHSSGEAHVRPAPPDSPHLKGNPATRRSSSPSTRSPNSIAGDPVIGIAGRRTRTAKTGCVDRDSSAPPKEGTRTPEKNECPVQRAGHSSVELLTAYSHTSARLYDLQKARQVLRRQRSDEADDERNEEVSRPRQWSMSDRLSLEDVQTIIDCTTQAPSPKIWR